MKSYLPAAPLAAKPDTDQPIAIKPEAKLPTTEIFLAPGKAKLGAQLGSETPVLTRGEPGMWRILDSQADFEGRRKPIAMHHEAQPVVTLNEGDYKVQVQVGNAQ